MKSMYFLLSFLCLISSIHVSAAAFPFYNAIMFKNGSAEIITELESPFREQIEQICEGFRAVSSDGKNGESVIEEDDVKIVFQCLSPNNTVEDSKWKIKLMTKYIKSFERNRPKRWFKEEQPNNFTCKDGYGRFMPLPLGVQRCYMQHYSSIVNTTDIDNRDLIYESGTLLNPSNRTSKYSCGHSFTWLQYNPHNKVLLPSIESAEEILDNQECAVKVSLTTMSFFCCCYAGEDLCGIVGNLTQHGLTCPQISMAANFTVDESIWRYTESESIEKRINATALILKNECHLRISVKRPSKKPKLLTSISLVNKTGDICQEMFRKIKKNNGCHNLERQCYTDVDDELVFCCRFVDDVEKAEAKILVIHAVYGEFVFGQLKKELPRLRKCLRPYAGSDDYCVYFYDKVLDRFVNIQIHENYRVSQPIKVKYDAFLKDTRPGPLYIEGELNSAVDKNVLGCNGTETMKFLPVWYRVTVAMFKCVTSDDEGTVRCDDFFKNETIHEAAKGSVEDQYLCDERNSTEPQPSWDMYCFELVMSKLNNNSDYQVTKIGASATRLTKLNETYNWSSDNLKTENINEIEMYWCAYEESQKNNSAGRLCACASYKTSKSKQISNIPCNDGHFARNMHLIETSPVFIPEPEPSKCVISSTAEDDGRHECVKKPEKGSVQSCVMGIQKGHQADIACLREPNLSHLKPDHRMEHYDWHVYQICNEIFKPEEEEFRCVIRSNHDSKDVTKYAMVCCCRSDACEAAYKHALKFKPRKISDIFVHKT